jgi:hypothetical protein
LPPVTSTDLPVCSSDSLTELLTGPTLATTAR